MEVRFKEALAYSELHGKKVLKKDLARKIFDSVNASSAQVNMANLISGRTKRISPRMICVFCEECGVTPNFLFGLE